MNKLNLVAALAAALVIMSASPAVAKNDAEKGKSKDAMQDRAQEVVDRAEMEQDQLPRHDKEMRKRVKDAGDIEISDDDDSANISDRDKSRRGQDHAATRGNEKAQEMRARRDERKAIKEEYKANGKLGERDLGADGDGSEIDIEEAVEDSGKKEKKPWWKFWGE